MSNPSRYAGSVVRPEHDQGASQGRSDSGGVDVILSGWKPGLDKVALTKALRAGGASLSEASRLTGEILDGRDVWIHLGQFDTVVQARKALTALGIAEVRG